MKRATSSDVARRAGVSRATVSYVLNNTPGQSITAATRDRVRAAARELDYTPWAAGRALVRGRTATVLLTLPTQKPGDVTVAVADHLASRLAGVRRHLELRFEAEGSRRLEQACAESTPQAVVSLYPVPGDVERAVRAAGVEEIVVPWNRVTGSPVFRSIGAAVGSHQVDVLVAAGHRRIGLVLMRDTLYRQAVLARVEGLAAGCAAHGLPEPLVLTMPGDCPTLPELFTRIGAAGVTGLATSDDSLGVAATYHARALGLDVPRDLGVVGVGDEHLARASEPGLSTITLDTAAIGAWVAEEVMAALGEPHHALSPVAEDLMHATVRGST